MFVEFDFSIFNYREHFKKSKVFFGLMNSINGKFEYLSNFREKIWLIQWALQVWKILFNQLLSFWNNSIV